MLSNLAVAALAAVGAVNAGPLQRRQATSSAVSAASSAVSSAISEASSAVSSAASGASSTVASDATMATSSASSAVSSGSSAASSAAASASTTNSTAMNNTYPAYPCPAGFLLTYASVNQTIPMSVTMVTQAAGDWASSPLFPNVTDVMGTNATGATHTINVGNISLPEVLVEAMSNETSGSAMWTWNGSLPMPVTAMGVSLSNYSTVLQIYDPDYTTTGSIGNSTLVKLFTNACATPQAAAMALLETLGGLELSNLVGALSGNSTSNATSSAAGASSTAAETASSVASAASNSASAATSSAASAASSAAESATSGAASAASAASSGAASAASAATSGAASVASAASSAAGSAAAAATSVA